MSLDKNAKEELNKLRLKINDIDDMMIKLLEQRMDISRSVGEVKKRYGLKIFDQKREEEILKNLVSKATNIKYEEPIKEIYNAIFSTSRSLQQEYIVKYKDLKLANENIKIAYQGMKGGYGYEASVKCFGDDTNLISKKHFEDVLLSIYEDESAYGILPVENSFTGTVNDVLDILVEYNAYIVGETYLKIEHALLANKDTNINNIKKVISHIQALKQSSKFIKSNGFEEKAATNTAEAAYLVSKSNNMEVAAIAGKKNADLYGLKILAHNIENMKGNQTRFIIVQSKSKAIMKGNKMSIRFTLPHDKSSLIKALLPIYNSDINLTSIISRPNPENAWQYYFYIDMVADWNNKNIINHFNEFKTNVYNINILGQYEEGVCIEK